MPQYDDQLETWNVKVTADTSDLEDKLRTTSRLGRQFSTSLISAFDDIAIKGKNVGDVFKSLALTVSQMALKSALQPLTSRPRLGVPRFADRHAAVCEGRRHSSGHADAVCERRCHRKSDLVSACRRRVGLAGEKRARKRSCR